MKKFGVLSLLGLAFSLSAQADADFKPIFVGGVTYYSGSNTKSLVSSSEKFISLTGEQAARRLRATAAADFGVSSGTAYFGTDTPKYSMFSASLAPGLFLFPFKDSSFQPFFGGKGVFGLQRFSMGSPPTGLSASSQGFHFGYEVAIGIDLRFKKGDRGTAVRLYGAVRSIHGTVAGQSSYDLSGFRFGVGLVF